jgi:hypothetical protein
VQFNRALALQREGRSGEAMDLLRSQEHEAREDVVLWPKWQVFEVELLTEQSRYLDACEMAEGLLARGVQNEDVLARLHAHYARALWKGFRRGRESLEQAWQAIAIDRVQPTAMFMIRDVENAKSANAHEYRLLVKGDRQLEAEDGRPMTGFHATYWVVADSPDEALSYAARFEPPEVRYRLKLVEAEKFDARPNQPKGVYEASGYFYF